MGTDAKARKPKNLRRKSGKGTVSYTQLTNRPTRIHNPPKSKSSARKGSHEIRKKPNQQRSKQMVEAILQAAAEIFARLGYARATTNKIAERAGVSVGSLYQYFPNKDSLLACLLSQHHAEVHQVIDTALARLADPKTPLEIGLRQLLTDLMALHQANPSLTKALSPAVLQESNSAVEQHCHDDDVSQTRLLSTLLASRPDVRDGNHDAMAAVLGETTSRLTRWLVHDPPSGVDSSALLDEVVRLQVRYLTGDGHQHI